MAHALKNLHRRTIPRDWETELAELCPPEDGLTYLKLIWEEGYPWEVVERFMIYEMIPAHAVDDEVLSQLQRDLPPQGYWDSVLEKFVPEDGCLITKRAHRLYKETGHWGRPWWVIQGTTGGHKRWFSQTEKDLLKLMGFPIEAPVPGALDYAPWDKRVVDQIMKYNLLRDEMGRLRRSVDLSVQGWRRREATDAKAYRKKLVEWLATQLSDVAPDVHKVLLELDAPRSQRDPKVMEKASEASEQNFIEHGRTSDQLITED